MKKILFITGIFLSVTAFSQYHNTTEKSPVNGDIRTTKYAENIVQKVKNAFLAPYYYTKTVTVRDSAGKLICRARTKAYGIGCEREIKTNFRYRFYTADKHRIVIKRRVFKNNVVLRKKRKGRLMARTEINQAEVSLLINKYVDTWSTHFLEM